MTSCKTKLFLEVTPGEGLCRAEGLVEPLMRREGVDRLRAGFVSCADDLPVLQPS